MRISFCLSLGALAATAAAQTTVYSNAAPRATSVVIPASDVGSPPLSYFGGSATDGTSLLVYGGRGLNAAGTAITTWYTSLDAYNPTTNAWTNLSADGNPSGPSATTRPGVAYDPNINSVVVFGGADSINSVTLDETWVFDLGTNTWSMVPNPTPGTTAPVARAGGMMAYDPASGGIIMFGGQGVGGATDRKNDTWLFIGNTWVQLAPATSPSERDLFSMTTRTAPYNDIIMFGGRGLGPAQTRFNDTWQWDGAALNWTQLTPINGTTALVFGGGNHAHYDSVRECVVMINGTGTGIAPSTLTGAGSWTCEYDCVLNEWRAYGDNLTNQSAQDPVIGRIQRFPVEFINGKAYHWSGQNVATAGDATLSFVKEYQADPIASSVAYGAGCTGPGGVLTLTADNAAWTGRTFSVTGTNFGSNSLALAVWGANQISSPIPLPQTGTGCLLLASADLLLGPAVPVGGASTAQLLIPSNAALAGAVLNVQIAELEFGLTFNWIGLFTSNGIAATIGALR